MYRHTRNIRWSGLFLLPLLFASCFRQVEVQAEIKVPGLQTREQAQYVTGMLTSIYPEGIRKAEADLDKRAIRVTYNTDFVRLKNIEGLIAEFGFDAGQSRAPAQPRFKMPAPVLETPVPVLPSTATSAPAPAPHPAPVISTNGVTP